MAIGDIGPSSFEDGRDEHYKNLAYVVVELARKDLTQEERYALEAHASNLRRVLGNPKPPR